MEHPPASARGNQRILVRYSIPFVTVAVAALFRLGLDPFLSWKAPLVFFILAILISARWGGTGPGLTATVFSVLAGAYLFMEPRFSLRVADPANLINLAFFAFAGAVVSIDPLGTKDKFKFAGEALDPQTGLYYLRARYYDPAVGRYAANLEAFLTDKRDLIENNTDALVRELRQAAPGAKQRAIQIFDRLPGVTGAV